MCEAFFPILSHEVRKLTSATPTALDVEWSYRKPDGTVASESETRRVTLLGLNDVMYSSRKFRETMTWHERFDLSPVIGAAYVSHTDPIMQRYAGMATRVARGVAASRSDHEAQRFMRAVYDLMWFHKIQYQSPPWMFKEGVRQHVKYGRDVLRNRAGTCIDLAILYASVCKAGGLDALLGQVPRHVFPIIRLPSGALQAVEATCIGGDRFGRKTSYEAACRSADKTLAKWRQDGRLYLIDVGKLRVASPLPSCPTCRPAHSATGASSSRPTAPSRRTDSTPGR